MTDVVIIGEDVETQPLPPDPQWASRGACRGQNMTRLFFPGVGEPTDQAKAVCASCPVITECRTHALEQGEKFGIWGGLSEAQRKEIRSGRVRRQSWPIKHGTPSGYNIHLRRGETPCAACRQAISVYRTARKTAKRDRLAEVIELRPTA
jgi:WhiB family redox-sensing transcriptional regulator